MIRILSLAVFIAITATSAIAQTSWVFFTDKGPETEASNLDAAVYPSYVNFLLEQEDIILHGTSRWLNAACVSGDVSTLDQKNFIRSTQLCGQYKVHREALGVDTSRYGGADIQLQMLGLDEYHQLGYTGKDIRIGVFDAGFRRLNTFKAFDSTWINGQIIAEYDFVRKDSLRYNTSMHGTSVLSIMGGNYPDSLMGAAPHASFVLARTEDAPTETHVEEYNWIKALEWADSVGVDIIHSSLGYSEFDSGHFSYTYADMDGSTTLITLATDIAYSKGIFITNSAGNQGAAAWRYITAPCDGKHVLCVGAVDSFEQKANFSSFGPSSDGRVKPEVVAMGKGTAHISSGGRLRYGNGTSFSGPLIAGMVACMMEANPRATNDQIFQAIIRSADRYQQPDSGYGYGLPNVMKADSILKGIVLKADQIAFEQGLRLYPNPVNSTLNIQSKKGLNRIVVYSSDMRTISTHHSDIQNNTSVALDLSSFAPGTYLVRIETSHSSTIRRISLVR